MSCRDDGPAGLSAYIAQGTGWNMDTPIGDRRLADLLRGRWDRIIVEQTAATDVVVANPDRRLILLRLRLPDDLQAERLAQLPPGAPVPDPTFYELKIEP